MILDGDVPLAPSYGVYISKLVWFAHVCTEVSDFNDCNLHLTGNFLQQGYRYHKLLKAFTKCFNHYKDLIQKCDEGYQTYVLWKHHTQRLQVKKWSIESHCSVKQTYPQRWKYDGSQTIKFCFYWYKY